MAQLYYRYSTMNAGKSIEVLKIAYNYEEQGKKVMLFTSELDNRYGQGYVASRIGIKREAIVFGPDTDFIQLISPHKDISCVLIDEGQFLREEQVIDLTQIVDYMNIPVIVYGLKNDFQNNLFEGSRALLIYADKIEEIKTVCWFCNKKATMVLRTMDGRPVYTGAQIQIGGNDSYIPVCRKCYRNPQLPMDENHTPDFDRQS